MKTFAFFRRVARPLFATLMLCTALGLAAPTATAQYGGNQGFLIDPSIVEQGERVNLLGAACGASTEIIFVIRELGLILSRTVTGLDQDGAFFVADVLVPEDVPPGLYTVEARCAPRPPTASVAGITARLEPLPGYVPDPRMATATLLVLAPSINDCIAATNASIKVAGQQDVTTTSIYCPTAGGGGVGSGSVRRPDLAFTGNRSPELWLRASAVLLFAGAFIVLFGRSRSSADGGRDRGRTRTSE